MHKTEVLNSQITFMKRLKYFKCSLSITTSYSQIFVFLYRKKFLLLLHHHHLFSWSYSRLALYPIIALRWSMRSNTLAQPYVKFSIWGFRARRHHWSLAHVMNDFCWLWWPMITGDGWGLSFSRHLSYSWGKPPEKSQLGKLTRPGIEPGPVCWEAGKHMLQQ